ncbi:MAG: nitroreductase family protein [Ktedonobacteraceae bacterium]|nr:nitroreductase family protein [Ktedonobacteraceae bacterium]
MDFLDAVRKRRMVRHFTSEAVAPEIIERIVQAAQKAPSAGYTQGQALIVVTRPELKQQIGRLCTEEVYEFPFVSEAAFLVIPCTSEAAYHQRYQEADKIREDGKEIRWPVPYWHMDIGCTVMLLLLAAVNEGLGAGFAGIVSEEDNLKLRELLHIPDEFTAVGVLPFGHPAPHTPSPSLKRGRKAPGDFAHYEQW